MTDNRSALKSNSNAAVPNPESLTNFQTHLLGILARGPQNGLGIKADLEEYFTDERINHGRLYPNLNALIERDLVEKSEIDKRTNEYALTERGLQTLKAHVEELSHGLVWPEFADDQPDESEVSA